MPYALLVLSGLVISAVLIVVLPSRVKVSFDLDSKRSSIDVSIKPVFLFFYIRVFQKVYEIAGGDLEKGFMDWLIQAAEQSLSGAPPTQNNGSNPLQRPKESFANNGILYLSMAHKILKDMEIAELSIRGRLGAGDPFVTALLCGGLGAVGGMLSGSRGKNGKWDIKIMPVYHRLHFALRARTVVVISILNWSRFIKSARKGKPS